MKYLLFIILFLIVLPCRAQEADSMMLIPIRWGWQLENNRQKRILFEKQVKDDGLLISDLEARNKKQEEALKFAHKTVVAQDSTIREKDVVIEAKDVIIKNKKGPIKWWWIPIAALAGWLVGRT